MSLALTKMSVRPRFYPTFISGHCQKTVPALIATVLVLTMVKPALSQAEGDAELAPTAGMFLVAAPKMRDPRFRQTVILLAEHSAEGSLGFIINKRTKMTIADVLPELELDVLTHALYFGGPVQPSRIMYVYSDSDHPGEQGLIRGVYWGADYDDLKGILSRKDENALRVFFGYAGWGPGQLEFEISLHDWQLIPASADHIFSQDSENLWYLLNREKPGVITKRFSVDTLNPYM